MFHLLSTSTAGAMFDFPLYKSKWRRDVFFFFSNTYCSSLENREALSGMFLLGIVFVLCLPKGVNSIRSECSHRFRADADDLESTFAV